MADIVVTPATGEIAIDLRTTFPATLAIEPATIDVALEPVGPAGPRGVQGATAFGWAGYSDNDAPTPIELDEGVRTRLDRSLAPTSNNNRLTDAFESHVFWAGTSPNKVIAARAIGDVIAVSVHLRVVAGRIDGSLTMEFDVGGAVGVVTQKTVVLTGDVGVEERIRVDFIFVTRATWVANGAAVYLTSSVPLDVLEVSPEFYPLSVTP